MGGGWCELGGGRRAPCLDGVLQDYTLGRRNIAEPLKFRHIPIEACQRAFILTLAKDRDGEVYSIVQAKCSSLALSGLASIPEAKGDLIMPHFLDHWGKPDIATGACRGERHDACARRVRPHANR